MVLNKRCLIIDTDTGADDASALILAASDPNVEILGVTVLVGNVDLEQGTKNALMALEMAGSNAPVFKGAASTFGGREKDAFSVFGTDGMGDADLIHPIGVAQEQDAVDFIIDTVRARPNEVEIVSLGPATNIAKAIHTDPATMRQVKRIWSMGTAGLGPGNATPVAEFNVFADAMAYKIMLDFGIPVTIVGLDMCDGEAMWTREQFDELASLNNKGAFVSASFGKLCEFYHANGIQAAMNCDSVAMMCVLRPDFVCATGTYHASCIVDEGETHAQVIMYKQGFAYDAARTRDFAYNVTLVTDVRKAEFFNRYKAAISDVKVV